MVLLCFCAVFMFIEHKNMQGVLWRLGKKLKQKSSIVLNSYIQKLTINEQKLLKLYLEKSGDDVFFYDVLFVNDRMVKRILKSK